MLTDVETLKVKKIILQDIYKIYEALILNNKISEEDAQKILDFVKNRLVPESHAKEFSDAVFEFAKTFPLFAKVGEKIQNQRNELLEKLGRECIEKLMDEDTDSWGKFSATLEQMVEGNLHDWFASLPSNTRAAFMEKFLTLSEDAI